MLQNPEILFFPCVVDKRRNEEREFGDSAQNHCYCQKKSLATVLVTEVNNVIVIYEGHIYMMH